MYQYVNTKTGARITVTSKISGNGWEEVKPLPEQPAKKPVRKTKAKK